MVPLGKLVTLHETTLPLAINQLPSVTISFNLKGSGPPGLAETAINRTIPSKQLFARHLAEAADQA